MELESLWWREVGHGEQCEAVVVCAFVENGSGCFVLKVV